MTLLVRSFELDSVEVAADGRTVELACMPFDRPAVVNDGQGRYREVFRRGAFRHVVAAPNRTALRWDHDTGVPYGTGETLSEGPTHLVGTFRVTRSEASDRLLSLARSGDLGVSVGYVPGRSRDGIDDDGPLVERILVKRLAEVSLTPTPMYADTGVLAVRSGLDDDVRAEVERARLHWRRLRLVLSD